MKKHNKGITLVAPHSCVYSGTNTINFSETVSNRWIYFNFYANANTKNINISNLKLNFTNGISCTVNDAVTNSYIKPLVICESSNSEFSWVWRNVMNILSGGSTTTDNVVAVIVLKVKDNSELKGITFSTNNNWGTRYDGVSAWKYKERFEISITPLD